MRHKTKALMLLAVILAGCSPDSPKKQDITGKWSNGQEQLTIATDGTVVVVAPNGPSYSMTMKSVDETHFMLTGSEMGTSFGIPGCIAIDMIKLRNRGQVISYYRPAPDGSIPKLRGGSYTISQNGPTMDCDP